MAEPATPADLELVANLRLAVERNVQLMLSPALSTVERHAMRERFADALLCLEGAPRDAAKGYLVYSLLVSYGDGYWTVEDTEAARAEFLKAVPDFIAGKLARIDAPLGAKLAKHPDLVRAAIQALNNKPGPHGPHEHHQTSTDEAVGALLDALGLAASKRFRERPPAGLPMIR